ncbi:MAG: Rrf2 family transcriptional regulator [Candidatus Bipolaricaulota bacterium]|nr:Rrf2 family transcriptional regulator [Candidatus Bipolaricaulota bacterium]MDW8141379.1 Rrf2 family transcriptional regulator [Candidatus Bipolaricaulota bacterium]
MKVTRKSDYGLRALYTLAQQYDNAPVSIGQLASEHGIPEPFLEKIMQELRDKGFVEAAHGRGGGYRLKKRPTQITLREVIRALDGPIALVTCLDPNLKCAIELQCPTSSIWEIINAKLEEYLASLTLEDIVQKYQTLKVKVGAKPSSPRL